MNQLPPCPYQHRCPTYRPHTKKMVRCWANVGGECQAHIRLLKKNSTKSINTTTTLTTHMVHLKCNNCGHAWDYQGKHKRMAICPDCRRAVEIPKEA